MPRSAYDVQRDFALSCGLRSQIIWDTLGSDETHILHEKIKALIPNNDQKNQNIIEQMRKKIFDSVWMQRKYTNRALLSTVIYVLVTEERDIHAARISKKFSCHPVFRTRKCLNSQNSFGCCMVFIDETGRVYKNWRHFVETNVLPKGMMVAPANGIYTFNNIGKVLLEFNITPAALSKTRVLNATDTVAGVGGLVATIPMAAALAFPIAAPVMAAATVATLTTAAYTTVRSAMQLSDRGVHEQSVALTDREARGNWLGIASGTVGLGASGATKALTYAATAGREITLGAKIVVNGFNVSSILLSGSGVVNSIYDIYMKIHDDDIITKIDVLQLAASLVVFTHSVNNLKIALNASKGNETSMSLRSQLSKQMRNLLNKISTDSTTLQSGLPSDSTSARSFDVIRIVNDIPFKDVLMDLHKQNPNLIQRGVIGDGFIKSLNNLILNYIAGDAGVHISQLAEQLGSKFVQHIVNPNSLLDVMNAMAKYFCPKVYRLLLNLTRTFIEDFAEKFDRSLRTFISTETVLYKMIMHCIKNYTQFSYEFMEGKTCEILNTVEGYFESLMPYSNGIKKQKCKACEGYFFICDL